MDTETWLDIRTRHAAGAAIKAIAREKGISRNTVRRALQSDAPPNRSSAAARRSGADDVTAEIQALLAVEPGLSAPEIARRIGWPHSLTALKERVRAARSRPTPAVVRPPDPGARTASELTSFVGRDRELAEIRLAVRSHRLVTLVGPGGVGKSRLARRVAAEATAAFADGVRTIELAPLRDPELVPQALLDGFGISTGETTPASALQSLVEHLQHRAVLLVLDDTEHLLDALAGILHPLLRAAPSLRVLITTRQAVGMSGEHVLPIAPLAVPETVPASAAEALRHPAVALFADRAASVLSGFALDPTTLPDVVELCRRLDGIPLAMELAAVRLRVLSLRQLLSRLADRFTVLTGGDRAGPARHRTLLATVTWSHELCTTTERVLWSHATVFPGSFDLDALEAVCARDATFPEGVAPTELLDAVSGLTSKSILIRDEDDQDGHVRFRMLETIREFGRERLPEAAARTLTARHLAYRLAVHEQLDDEWYGPDQARWVRRMKIEQADLRSALTHALAPGGDPVAALRLVGRPWFQWSVALSMTEHRRWLTRALAAAPLPGPERATALATAAFVASLQGDHPAAEGLVKEALTLAEDTGDPLRVAHARHAAGLTAFFSDDFTAATRLFDEAEGLYRAAGAASGVLFASLDVQVGLLRISCGDLDAARDRLVDVHERSCAAGDTWIRSYALDALGFIALLSHDVDRARRLAQEALRATSRFDDTIGLSLALDLAAWTAAADGRYERCAVLLGAASSRWGSFGNQLYGSPDWQARRQGYEQQARETLGDPIFETAFQHGASTNARDILDYALAHAPDPLHSAEEYLTPREYEIAGLVARGMTNREIAERLVLSHRTVEGHISRALTKLGFARRSQLAAWMERTRTRTSTTPT